MISIVIPVYNNLDETKQVLQNIRVMLKEDFEIIIVDDWSEDGTRDWLDKQDHDFNNPFCKGFTYLNNWGNKWVTYSWNRWVRESRGDYIFVINNDIKILSEDTISILRNLSDYHTIACPCYKRKHLEDVNNNNWLNIAWFAFMFRVDKSLFPIDERLKIWYNDNRLWNKAKGNIWWWWMIRHYESKTINKCASKWKIKLIYDKIQKIIKKDSQTWETIKAENNR